MVRRYFIYFLWWSVNSVALLGPLTLSHAGPIPVELQPMNWSAQKVVRTESKDGDKIELFGRAVVQQPGQKIEADHIVLHLKTGTLEAKGNCLYANKKFSMLDDAMVIRLGSSWKRLR